MALSIGFRIFSFLPSCYSSYGALTFTPAGLTPAVHASLRWTHASPLLVTAAELSLSNIHEPQFVNILGHAAGTIIFGIFVYLLLLDRAENRLRGCWLSVADARLACLWNVGSLVV